MNIRFLFFFISFLAQLLIAQDTILSKNENAPVQYGLQLKLGTYLPDEILLYAPMLLAVRNWRLDVEPSIVIGNYLVKNRNQLGLNLNFEPNLTTFQDSNVLNNIKYGYIHLEAYYAWAVVKKKWYRFKIGSGFMASKLLYKSYTYQNPITSKPEVKGRYDFDIKEFPKGIRFLLFVEHEFFIYKNFSLSLYASFQSGNNKSAAIKTIYIDDDRGNLLKFFGSLNYLF